MKKPVLERLDELSLLEDMWCAGYLIPKPDRAGLSWFGEAWQQFWPKDLLPGIDPYCHATRDGNVSIEWRSVQRNSGVPVVILIIVNLSNRHAKLTICKYNPKKAHSELFESLEIDLSQAEAWVDMTEKIRKFIPNWVDYLQNLPTEIGT